MGYISSDPTVEEFKWLPIRWQPTTLTGTVDEVIATLPAGTLLLGAFMVCVRGDTGATSTTVDIEIGPTGAGDVATLTGASDNGGTAGLTTDFATIAAKKTALDGINAISLGGSALKVNVECTFVGTATVAPIMEVYLLAGRLVR